MFLIAGPVIVFGTAASVIYGVVLWLLGGIRNGLPSGKPFAVLGLYPDGCRKGGQSSRSCFCLWARTRARMPP